jgi:hypothetical protein
MATIASSIAIQGAILQRIEERGCGPVLQTPTVVQPSTIEGVPTYKAFRWNSDDGQVEHTVPEGFEYPSYTVGIMFNLWFFGDLPRFLRPFKEIPGVDLPTKLCKTNYSRCKKVISALTEYAIRGKLINRLSEITIANAQSIYDYGYDLLLQSVFPVKRANRCDHLNINTVANLMYRLPNDDSVNIS